MKLDYKLLQEFFSNSSSLFFFVNFIIMTKHFKVQNTQRRKKLGESYTINFSTLAYRPSLFTDKFPFFFLSTAMSMGGVIWQLLNTM